MTSTLPYIISLFIITMIFRDISCNEILNISEGDNVTLEFKYDLEPGITFKIRINQVILYFYANGEIINAGFTESQHNRFSVIESVITDYKSVRVSITNVSRQDEANYTCNVFRNSEILENLSQTIWLIVEFPVRPVQCSRVSNEHNPKFDLWIMVECNATVSRYRDFISCYQFGESVPSVTHLVITTIFVQTMWMRITQQLFCCSLSSSNLQNGCDCHNFVWDPVTESQVEGSIAPFCSTSSTNKIPEETANPLSRSHTLITVTPSQSGGPTTEAVECSHVSGGDGFKIAFFIVFFILMILLGYLCNRNKTWMLGVLLNV